MEKSSPLRRYPRCDVCSGKMGGEGVIGAVIAMVKNFWGYVRKMRGRDPELNSKWGTICTPLGMVAADGKTRRIMAANVEGILRIIQSIPSPKAEP